jgi:hypothetical protein
LSLLATMRVARATPSEFHPGDPVSLDDVGDIESVELQDSARCPITIPDDYGFCLILSHQWRKCLLFDYSVFGPEGKPRTDKRMARRSPQTER